MKLAIIPARGGSKRIPRKNIKPFCGKPMIAWTIEAARNSKCFDRIIVSTDDAEIAGVARQWGAEVPFVRPEALANDYAGATAVVAHATEWAISTGLGPEAVCCLLATSPLLQQTDLQAGWKAFSSGAWDYVFSATDFAAPIFRAFQETTEGGVQMFFPERFDSRSQDLPLALHDAAQFYWGKPGAWLESRRVFGPNSAVVFIPRWRVQDIDTPDDWRRAELLSRLISEQGF